MPVPTDKALYEKVKRQVYKQIPKHSAYRSGILVQKYKSAYRRKHRSGSPYSGKRTSRQGLGRWFAEKWRNQRGEVGYRRRGDVYRPTRRVTSKTPLTYRELSRGEIRRAMRTKARKGRVSRFRSRY